jgi:hypothetical protein
MPPDEPASHEHARRWLAGMRVSLRLGDPVQDAAALIDGAEVKPEPPSVEEVARRLEEHPQPSTAAVDRIAARARARDRRR